MNPIIETPFTPEQVELLNEYQNAGIVHPFTCGKRDEHPQSEDILLATEDGWRCPSCDYEQNWAWEGMLRIREALAELEAWREQAAADAH